MEPREMDHRTQGDGSWNSGRKTTEPWEMGHGTQGDGPWNPGRWIMALSPSPPCSVSWEAGPCRLHQLDCFALIFCWGQPKGGTLEIMGWGRVRLGCLLPHSFLPGCGLVELHASTEDLGSYGDGLHQTLGTACSPRPLRPEGGKTLSPWVLRHPL